MRGKVLSLLAVLVLAGSGCATHPESRSFREAAKPRLRGPETSQDLLYGDQAHRWTDDDARTALWYTRNFPDDVAAFGFALHKLISYNRYDTPYNEHYNVRNDGTLLDHNNWDVGLPFGGIFHTTSDEVFPILSDPQLRVKMLSLEARERNRLRERERRHHTGEYPFTVESRGGVAPSDLSPQEVEHRLMEIYR